MLILPQTSLANMGVTKTTHKEGSGAQPAAGQTVTIEYTGFLKDTSKPDNKGKQYVHATPRSAAICMIAGRALMPASPPYRFDSSVGRGDFVTKIGVGQVIKGKHFPSRLSFDPPGSHTNDVRDRLGRGRHPDEGWREGHSRHHRVRLQIHPREKLDLEERVEANLHVPATTATVLVASRATSPPTRTSSCEFTLSCWVATHQM